MPAYAYQTILDEWRDFYPNSNSDDLECRLCHVNPTGNSPWNAYGITIRNVLEGLGALGGGATPNQLREAFGIAESVNLDGDPSGATSIAEIIKSYQPGWTQGNNNVITSVDGNGNKSTMAGQPPPQLPTVTTSIDPAIPASNNLPFIQSGNIELTLETIASGFSSPVMAARANGLPGYLFVVEQGGKIWRIRLSNGSRILFHDLSILVPLLTGGERGLLGLAFDPNFDSNGFFYTYHSERLGAASADFSTMPNGDNPNHQTVVSEWITTNPTDLNNFGVSSVSREVVRIDQPQGNHNGGMLQFGPDDFLYISLGDGGGADDVGAGHGDNGNGRDNTNPLGAILRIDPRGFGSMNGEYGIPADNPFVLGGSAGDDNGLDEIYAYGFRNPYRFSFDSLCFENGQNCNTLLVGDVGQGEVEEINNVEIGGNYGWNWKEGSFFFYQPTPSIYGGGRYISLEAPPSVPNNLIDPLVEYRNSSMDGRSSIGGYVYRGSEFADIEGLYVFADYFNQLYYVDSNNEIRRFRLSSALNNVAGFAEDHDKELYVLTSNFGANGALRKLVPSMIDEEFCLPIQATNGNIALICL